ncbi:sensor histidine kinase [Marinilabilia sp.]|uniref:sensor histidine kinase n=1 Tax=Marinilabilia sp. TaxID=2021252 RepID=UPI0025C3A2CA|nr:histidine kinase [Marinilabilia sp.]
MKPIFCKFSILLVFSFIESISVAKPLCDSLFNDSKHKIIYLENNKEIVPHITDTSGWDKSRQIELSDINGKNQVLFKQKYRGKNYHNPTLLLIGYSSGFEIYRDSVLIYSALAPLSSKSTTHFYDSHFIPLKPPLDSSVFVLRIPFKSYLDATSFSAVLVGEGDELGRLAVAKNRKEIKDGIAENVMGLFLIFTALLSLAAFFIRLKKPVYLLVWYFLFAGSQGYIFLLEDIHLIFNILPSFYFGSMIVIENLVPIGILGIVGSISGYSKTLAIKIMIALHLAYAASSIFLFQFEFFQILFWILVVIDIILFVHILFVRDLYKIKDFRIPVLALCLLFSLVILDVFAVFNVFFIADDLSSYGMLLLALSFAQYIEKVLYNSRQKNITYEVEIQQTKNKILLLENQRIIAQYEVLKNQVNPHFLFNSLNALSALIRSDEKAALTFIEKFSSIYRFVLDANNKTVIELNREIDFVNSYFFLQKMRYGKSLSLNIETDIDLSGVFVVPLSIQILVENAIKHNEISDKNPLHINICIDGTSIFVKNPINKLNYQPKSNRMGLKNLKARYGIISDIECSFTKDEKNFVATIPVLKRVPNS